MLKEYGRHYHLGGRPVPRGGPVARRVHDESSAIPRVVPASSASERCKGRPPARWHERTRLLPADLAGTARRSVSLRLVASWRNGLAGCRNAKSRSIRTLLTVKSPQENQQQACS